MTSRPVINWHTSALPPPPASVWSALFTHTKFNPSASHYRPQLYPRRATEASLVTLWRPDFKSQACKAPSIQEARSLKGRLGTTQACSQAPCLLYTWPRLPARLGVLQALHPISRGDGHAMSKSCSCRRAVMNLSACVLRIRRCLSSEFLCDAQHYNGVDFSSR